MMKKFLFLITASMLAGMLGAYVTTASACDVTSDPSCCKPTAGVEMCDPNAPNALVDSCGNDLRHCSSGQLCYGATNTQGYCIDVTNSCDPSQFNGCVDSNRSLNCLGEIRSCGAGNVCHAWEGCVPETQPTYRWCNNISTFDGKSYGRYSSLGISQICPGGCSQTMNAAGLSIGNATCNQPSVCPLGDAQYRHCSNNKIVNGCNEVIDDCGASGLTCAGALSSCSCKGDDVCPNIDGAQTSIPAGMFRDKNGNCVGKLYQPTEMSITKTADKKIVHSGDLVTYTITTYNNGSATFTDNAISDVLPAGMKFVSSDRGHHVVDKNGYHVRNDVGFKREVLADGQWYYKGAYDGDGPTNIVCSTEGKATITDPKDLFYPGKQLCYHTNTYDWWLSYGVNDYRSWGPGGSSQDEWMRRQYLPGDTIIWFWGALSAGSKATLTITAQYDGSLPSGTCITNTTTGGIGNPQTNTKDDVASATVCVDYEGKTDITITKSVDKSQFPNTTGEIITWTLNYQNNGPNTANDVTIEDILPAGLVYDGPSMPADDSIASIIVTGQKVQYVLSQPLVAGGKGSIVVKSRYAGGKANNTQLLNIVKIDTSTPESDYTNNADDEPTKPMSTVNSDVQITKTVDTTGFLNLSGQLITWTLNYQNNGPQAATDVIVTDNLPLGLRNVQSTSIAPSLATSVGIYKWNLGTLAVGQTGQIIITSRYAGDRANGEVLTNVATIETSSIGDLISNNTGSASTKPYGIVSCNNLVTSTSGFTISYRCDQNGGASAAFKLYSGTVTSGVLVSTTVGFTGSITVAPGHYEGQCVIDGSVTSSKNLYVAPNSSACDYRTYTVASKSVTCAVSASTTPYLPSLDHIMMVGGPVAYCPSTLTNANSSCVAVVKDSQIITEDVLACTKPITIIRPGRLGDFVWLDKNKNGIQDTGEAGIAGVGVELYNCSTNTLITGAKTDSAGKYLFDRLIGGSYKVKFTLPNGYERSPFKVGTNTGVDSSAPESECVYLDPESGIDQNLTLDAGVYSTVPGGGCDPTKICCQQPCNGGGGWCGDGVKAGLVRLANGSIVGEQCDDGNNANSDGCDNYCQSEPIIPHQGTGKQIVNVNPLSCGMIDPPDVMVGEYVPFWWKYDNPSDVHQVSSCNDLNQSNTDPNDTYVLDTTDTTDGQLCAFYLKNGAGEKSKLFYKYCNVKQQFNSANLTETYLDGASSIVRNSYSSSLGASYVAPGHWTKEDGSSFTKFGEYQIVWDKTTYRTCNRVENKNASGVVSVNYVKSTNRWVADNADCTMNLTVTKPYMTQKNGLSASSGDLQVMNNIINLDGTTAISGSPTTISNVLFSGSSNLTYLIKQFVQKYSKLASKNDTIAGISAKKVPNSNIYIIGSGERLIANANLGSTTIIVPEGDLTIMGSIKGNVMIIVPNGIINIKSNGAADTQIMPGNQLLQGVYIAKQVTSDDLRNSDIDKSWKFGGQLKIDGLLVNTENGQDAINSLKNMRRSSLTDYTTNPFTSWFQVLPAKRSSIVQNGASLQITSSSSLWTNLPPGANELMKELQAFK